MKPTKSFRWLVAISVSVALFGCSSCFYMKMAPPADVDKASLVNNNTCYLATAANLLAGAGYGNGTSLQARANDIYGQLVTQYGTVPSGWTDVAVSWWLGSANNVWPNNPYTLVTVYGNKSPKYPWSDANGARFIGNELRRCQFVGLSISWPTDAVDASGANMIGSGGHAITCWGDNGGDANLTTNPGGVRVTDSDTDAGGDVQGYTYDAYTNPNPGGANEGNGWYFAYDNNHPYIKHIVTLCPVDRPSGTATTQKVVGSYRIHQAQKVKATDLHYQVGTDVEILSYKTTVNWSASNSPSIVESQPQRRKLTVNWDFTDKPVPYCTWVTINTEFILPVWNSMSYDSVHFTYPKGTVIRPFPSLRWEMKTAILEKAASIRNVTGGYVVGAFDVLDPTLPSDSSKIGEYRFIHEYSYNQMPEEHTLLLRGSKGFSITNLRFGHTYGYISADSLWGFNKWMTEMGQKVYQLEEKEAELKLNWQGRLPYPEGEDIKGRIPEKGGGLKPEIKN